MTYFTSTLTIITVAEYRFLPHSIQLLTQIFVPYSVTNSVLRNVTTWDWNVSYYPYSWCLADGNTRRDSRESAGHFHGTDHGSCPVPAFSHVLKLADTAEGAVETQILFSQWGRTCVGPPFWICLLEMTLLVRTFVKWLGAWRRGEGGKQDRRERVLLGSGHSHTLNWTSSKNRSQNLQVTWYCQSSLAAASQAVLFSSVLKSITLQPNFF